MSLISGKHLQCLLEKVPKYYNHGYPIPKLWAYHNHGMFKAILNEVTIHKKTNFSEKNQHLSLFSLKLTIRLVARRASVYNRMAIICTIYGHTLTMVVFLVIQKQVTT